MADHTAKYTSVIINGFSKLAEEKDVYDILLEGGLPKEYEIGDIKRNEKNGQLVIENLDSTDCISLTEHIHGKKFFNRKVFITSVVQKSPEKSAEATEDDEPEATEDDEPAATEDDEPGSSSESDPEEVTTVEKPPCTKLFSTFTGPVKRPAGASPEESSETKAKEKKKSKTASSASAAVRSSLRQGKPTNK